MPVIPFSLIKSMQFAVVAKMPLVLLLALATKVLLARIKSVVSFEIGVFPFLVRVVCYLFYWLLA